MRESCTYGSVRGALSNERPYRDRREFITLLGGAAAWPLAARAQQGERMRRIGVLHDAAADDPERQVRLAAFLQGLQQLGWNDGRNVQIEYPLGRRRCRPIRRYAAELVALAPDVILALGRHRPRRRCSRQPAPCRSCSCMALDPVGAGFVDSLARPGGNATGFMQFEYGMGGKWLELLKEIAPHVTRVAVIRDPANPPGSASGAPSRPWRRRSGWSVSPVNVRDARRDRARRHGFRALANGGLIVTERVGGGFIAI